MARHQPLDDAERERITASVKKLLAQQEISVSELARRAGVDQPMAFNVTTGRFKKRTPKLMRLELYVHMKLGLVDPIREDVDRALEAFIASGGDVRLLAPGIGMLAAASAAAARLPGEQIA